MASTSETGHAKNVANFRELITRVEKLGNAYIPVNSGLQLEALKGLHLSADQSMKAVSEALSRYARAVDAREAAFEPLGKLVTRALNMFKISVQHPGEIDSAASLAKKIRGGTGSKAAPAEGEPAIKRSNSQKSYDMMVEHFSQFIDVLTANPGYAPNEEDLKVESLSAFLAGLKSKTQAVNEAEALLDAARSQRNNLLYTRGNGLIDVAMDVKSYVKGALIATAPQYQPILSLQFRSIKV